VTGVTRFDADTAADRRTLFAEAVTAHRTRASPFCTMEADPDVDEDADDPAPAPWIQFAEQTFNMDCTDAELEALKALLEEFPEFRIDELTSPETAEGTNVRVTARSDPARLAEFVDRAFQAVYGCDPDYRAWVAAV
jgi:hypothetical protein